MDQNTLGATPNKVVPLLQSLSRIEVLAVDLTTRLDPIVQHQPTQDPTAPPATNTVTNRINQVGDVLQYLLDHIEL